MFERSASATGNGRRPFVFGSLFVQEETQRGRTDVLETYNEATERHFGVRIERETRGRGERFRGHYTSPSRSSIHRGPRGRENGDSGHQPEDVGAGR